jgi:hypothetical protein
MARKIEALAARDAKDVRGSGVNMPGSRVGF